MIRAHRALALPAIVLAMLSAAPALADDPRLVELEYDPAKVVLIEGRTNIQATIAFAEDELIENVAIGDSASWQVTPNKRANLLFVKPLEPKAATNMTVVTDKRTYLFDLVARSGSEPLYVLRFNYPDEPEKNKDTQLALRPSDAELTAVSDPYAVTDPAQINREWKGNGEAKLLPANAYDDGDATFLSWTAGTPIPAILIKNKEGVEGPVNYAVRGDTIVIDGVPREIILRSGDDVAILVNQAPERRAGAGPENVLAVLFSTDRGETR
jgi:type IV secretion system protein VirB9